jgi:outer membrane protein assembly factor BamD (BamD/ComL family)
MNRINRWTTVGILAAGLIVATFIPGHSAEAQDKDAIAYKQAYNFVLQEKWTEALKAMEDVARTYPKSAWVDDARFWQCYSREKLDQPLENVFKCYQKFTQAYPGSEWADDARSNMIRLGRALAKAGKPEYEAIIQSMRKDEEADVKLAALYALMDIGDTDALKTIINLYDNTENSKLKNQIVFMLHEFDSPEAFAKLSAIALKDPDLRVRKSAVMALGSSDNPEAACQGWRR